MQNLTFGEYMPYHRSTATVYKFIVLFISAVSLMGSAINLLRSNSSCVESSESSSSQDLKHQSSWANVLDSLHSVLEEPTLTSVGPGNENSWSHIYDRIGYLFENCVKNNNSIYYNKNSPNSPSI